VESLPPITICETDFANLERLVSTCRLRGEAASLAAELERARVVDAEELDRGVVTMNSVVCFEDEETGEQRQITIVYPHGADANENRISVLAPVGAALLGLCEGQTISWPLPSGRPRRYRIVNVVSHPDADAART